MKKFKIEVIRTDFYEIEVDENVWTKEELKKWSNVFYPAENQKELAENLANSIMRLGSDYGFIEGFGYVKTFRCDGSQRKHFEGLKEVPDDKYANGISIKIINENDDYEINSYEVNNMNKDLTLLERRIIAKNTLSAYKWYKIIKMGHKKETYDYFKIPKYYYELKFYLKNNPIITKFLHLI